MPCPHDNLPLLATGRLSGFAKWRAERHFKSCPDCTAELAQLSSLSGQLRALTLSEPSADLDERVLAIGYGKSGARPSLPRPTLHGFLLAFPLLMAVLMGCLGLPFIKVLPLFSGPPRLVAKLEIVWNPALESTAPVRQELPTIIDSLAIDKNVQNVENWSQLEERETSLSLKQRVVSGNPTNAILFDRWIDNIARYGKARNNLWTVQVKSAPQKAEKLAWRQRAVLLLYFLGIGLFFGGIVSLTIWLLRAGGILSVIPFVFFGALGGFVFNAYQSIPENKKMVFHAEGELILSPSHDSLRARSRVLQLAESAQIQQNLQDAEKYKIRILRVENGDKEGSLRFSASGRYANYTAGTVNLWMRRVQDHLLKEWKEKEHPSRVDEMTPPVRIVEAVNPEKPIPTDLTGNVATGLFLGLFFGVIYGYFYRGIPKKPAVYGEYRERRGATAIQGENPVRIPISIIVGVGIGSSLGMLVTLFQAPVYEASGKALVKTPGALTRVVEWANRGVSKNVMERLQREKSRVFVPEVRVEPIEKTPFLRFYATADDPDLVAQAVNETLRETILEGEKNGIRVNVIDEAFVPSQPIGPSKPLNLALGAGLGGLLGTCFGILRRR